MGGGFLHPHLPGSGNIRGGGGCSPQPQGRLGWPGSTRLYLLAQPSSLGSWLLLPLGLRWWEGAVSSARPEVLKRDCTGPSQRGCWRSPVSVPQGGLWAAWPQGGLRGLTTVGSRTGWGCRAGSLLVAGVLGATARPRNWAVGSQSVADANCIPSSSWRHWLCTWGRRVCSCLCRGRGAPGLLGPPGAERRPLDLSECACVWCPWHPPLIHPSEARLGLCKALGTCDGLMWSPPSRSPCFVRGRRSVLGTGDRRQGPDWRGGVGWSGLMDGCHVGPRAASR